MITLKRLEARNFKSLRSVTLVFPECGSVLIEGNNEAGKSTLFEAVYVALYGRPLVGEDKAAKQEEVIQYGQSQAMVELTLSVEQQELTISRHFERGKSQQAKLVIQRPDVQLEEVNRVRAVDDRILKELGNLDGDSLRNSCFVEQKELGRVEALSRLQREQAIQKLLGLERLTQLMDQFKFKREQERELNLAQSSLLLARFQAEVRVASTEEAEQAERLDAVKVAIQIQHLSNLEEQKEKIERFLAACDIRIQEASERLNYCARIKENVGECDKVGHQITNISHARTELLRVAEELRRLDTIEQVELPQARITLGDVSTAAEAITQTVQARKQVQLAEDAVREAQRCFKELEQAENEQRQRAKELEQAKARVAERHKEAGAEQRRFMQQLNDLGATTLRLEEALAAVKQWEAANDVLLALRKEISVAEEKEQMLHNLQTEMRRREDEVQTVEEAVAHSEKEMQKATHAVHLARTYEALTTWVRLKGVEMALGGYATQHTELVSRRQEAEKSLITVKAKTRIPRNAGIVLATLGVLALIPGFLWPPAFALVGLLLCGAVVAWLWYMQATKAMRPYSEALAQREQELQRLDMQRQAAIQTGGDPVTLNQYEEQLLASGVGVPSTHEAGRSLEEELRQQLGTMPGNHTIQEAAQNARDTHTRLAERLRQTRSVAEGTAQTFYLAHQQAGNVGEQLVQLRRQETEQEKMVMTDEGIARQTITEGAQWPTSSNTLQTMLSTCRAELRTAGEAQKRQEQVSAKFIQEAEADKAKVVYLLQQAQAKVTTVKASDPVAQLSRVQENVAEMKAICYQREEATRPLLSKLHLQLETEVEAVRGRTQAQVQALENALSTRPQQQKKYDGCKAILSNALTTTFVLLSDLLTILNTLAIKGLPTLPQLLNCDDIFNQDEPALTATLDEIRKSLQTTLNALDEQGTRKVLDEAFGDKGRIEQQKDNVEKDIASSQRVVDNIFAKRGIAHSSTYNYTSIVTDWSLIAQVSLGEERQVTENLEAVSKRLYAASQQEKQLAMELQHPGTPLFIEKCKQAVDTLLEEREICGWATRLLKESHDRIARRVLPITERNMQPLLQQLTGGRYCDVRLTPEETDGQLEALDYRIRVWDPAARRYVAKNIFSGGTRDQCSLALRLAFALATLPQELGVAPGFIFLDEPLSAFDSQRAQALVELITTGTIAQQFHQVILISHQHAFDREAFDHHIRMEAGQMVESDLPHSEESPFETIQLQPVSDGSV